MREDLLKDLYRGDDGMPKSLRDLLHRDEIELEDARWVLDSIFLPKETDDHMGIGDPGSVSYTQRLEDAKKGWEPAGCNTLHVNTDPFGVSTNSIFQKFVGVCAGRRSLSKALSAVEAYCEKSSRSYGQQPKTAILLTDKWDWSQFQKGFELPFLRYSLEYNVLFVFLLVTDYGVSRIPFLGGNHAELARLRGRGYAIESEHPGVSVLNRLKQGLPCTYECHSGTWAQYGSPSYYDLHYSFDFHAMRCTIRGDGPEAKIKVIPGKAAHEFAAAVCELLDQRDLSYTDPGKTLDAGHCLATVGDVSFSWYGVGLENLDQPYQKAAKAFEKLIGSLKEVRKSARSN